MKASNLVYSPTDVSLYGTQYLEWKRDHKEFGVPFFEQRKLDRVLPMFPGEMMSIIARPGHAKTSVMMYWARQRAAWLKENGHENRVVIYATWEQSIEELHSFYVAAQQRISISNMAKGTMDDTEWDQVATASAKRISEPLWFIGHSSMRRTGRTLFTVNTLMEAVDYIRQQGYEVDLLMADYLQRMQAEEAHQSPVVQYSRIVDDLKNFALGFGLPLVVGVQAAREVDEIKVPIPEMHHAQWTSNVEQSSDRVISLVRPRRYKQEGEPFGPLIVQGNNQLLVNVCKQKLGEANFIKVLSFDPRYNELDDKEVGV